MKNLNINGNRKKETKTDKINRIMKEGKTCRKEIRPIYSKLEKENLENKKNAVDFYLDKLSRMMKYLTISKEQSSDLIDSIKWLVKHVQEYERYKTRINAEKRTIERIKEIQR